MAVNNPYAQYQQNAVLNARPAELVTRLFTGALKFIRQAEQAIESKDIEGAHNALVRAQDIFAYLRGTLNPDYEIAQNLDALYDYICERLVQANLKKDREILAEAGRMVEELRETWIQALTPKPAPDL